MPLRQRHADRWPDQPCSDCPTRRASVTTTASTRGGRYPGSCAPRTRRRGGRDSVDRAFVLWADCDGEDAVAALRDFEPQPAIVISSGTGSNCHAYWPLTELLPRDEVERANRRLAHALGEDFLRLRAELRRRFGLEAA